MTLHGFTRLLRITPGCELVPVLWGGKGFLVKMGTDIYARLAKRTSDGPDSCSGQVAENSIHTGRLKTFQLD